jgi:transcription-repair coupling factor (superfamily II helicase)
MAPNTLVERLVFLGYERLPEVEAVGHFARRGGILDVYPTGLADPLRLEFDGDTLVSLRRFDGRHAALARTAPTRGRAADATRWSWNRRSRSGDGAAARAWREGDEEAPRMAAAMGTSARSIHDGMERFASHYDPELGTLLDYLRPTRS